ncbi:MAG TPA: hypothetical protein VF797_16755 [Noviherbaspirillum sp.]
MDIQDDHRRQLIDSALDIHAGASQVIATEKALQTWEQLARHLSPLIGEAGFCALYARALCLTRPQDCQPAAAASSAAVAGSISQLLASLKKTLANAGPDNAGNANAALLATFTRLLSTLIGEALTIRLMNAAWHDEPQQKNAQEHK